MELPDQEEAVPPRHPASFGTILEAAFVDPAYQWPPPEGEGKNAIELQASISLIDDDDNSVKTTASQRKAMEIPPKPGTQVATKRWWNCCKSTDALVDLQGWERQKKAALQARKDHHQRKKLKEREHRRRTKYNRVPEGILIYRLDTATQLLTLLSEPHSKTDLATLVTEIVVASARPSSDKSRRGMILTGVDGKECMLVACEQRTAIAWLEAMDLMLANVGRRGESVRVPKTFPEGEFWMIISVTIS
jgi:hypothetical protein